MAHIKCRYSVHVCENHYYEEVEWDTYFFCDCNDWCPYNAYTRPDKPGLIGGHDCGNLVNPICYYSYTAHREFEGDYKRYKYDEECGLVITKKMIPIDQISYLQIDERVLINTEDE